MCILLPDGEKKLSVPGRFLIYMHEIRCPSHLRAELRIARSEMKFTFGCKRKILDPRFHNRFRYFYLLAQRQGPPNSQLSIPMYGLPRVDSSD